MGSGVNISIIGFSNTVVPTAIVCFSMINPYSFAYFHAKGVSTPHRKSISLLVALAITCTEGICSSTLVSCARIIKDKKKRKQKIILLIFLLIQRIHIFKSISI